MALVQSAHIDEGAIRLPRRLSGIRRNRLVYPPQVAAINCVILGKCGFDYERAIRRRVLALYAAITHQGRRLAGREPAVFVATIWVVTPSCEMNVRTFH